MLRKLLIPCLAILSIVAVSCTKDDNLAKEVAGTYNCTASFTGISTPAVITVSEITKTTVKVDLTDFVFGEIPVNISVSDIVLSKSGTKTLLSYSGTVTYSMGGQAMPATANISGSIENDKLNCTINVVTQAITLPVTITGTKLVILK
ncbi:MAG: calycin-like domain-containing protein [Bacteroidales bacterium]|nr:calycin-like domain-containing protein [Bacteroidales bacterium]MDD4670260.1 calycin-like domain-containing protein [Bacteroidales bacterium]